MKRQLIPTGFFLGLLLLRLPTLGQDAAVTNAAADVPASAATRAAAAAEQQGVDEKFKQLAADIATLSAANQLLLEKVAVLKDDLEKVRADQTRFAAGAVGREDLKSLAQRIEEVDKKRQEDRDAISDEIKKSAERLEKLLTNAAVPASRPPRSPGAGVGPAPARPPRAGLVPVAEDSYTYTVQSGDRIRTIVRACNDEFISKGMKTITTQQAMDANPGVDWSNLKIGQKIVIPHPPK